MKKRILEILLISAITICGLTACGNPQGESNNPTEDVVENVGEEESDNLEDQINADENPQEDSLNESSDNESHSKKSASIPVLISDNYDSLSTEEDGYFSYAYMTVDGLVILCDGYDALKESLQSANESAWNDAQDYKKELEDLLKDTNYEKMDSMPWEYESRITAKRFDETVSSYQRVTYSYLGGAHPSTVITGYNFDSETGEEITVKDLFVNVDDVVKIITDKIEETEYVKSGLLFEDWQKTVTSLLTGKGDLSSEYGFSFLIEKDKIHFIFDTYTLGAYALGPVEIDLSLSEYSNFIQDKYKVENGLLCDVIDQYGEAGKEYSYDFDKNGEEELIRIEVVDSNDYDQREVIVSYGKDADHLQEATISDCYDMSAAYVMENEKEEYYLYVEVVRENDWRNTTIFDLNNPEKGPVEIKNKYDNSFYNFVPSNSKHVYVEDRVYLTGTYSGYTEAYVDEDGQLKPYEDIYSIMSLNHETVFDKNAVYPTSLEERFYLTVLEDFETLSSSDMSDFTTGDSIVIKEGEKCYPWATDKETYMIFKLEDGSFIKLEYDPMGEDEWEHKINGVYESQLFDGIIYAG